MSALRAGVLALVMAVVALVAGAATGQAQIVPSPPLEPAVSPEIPAVQQLDVDDDKIDDRIEQDLAGIGAALGSAAPTEAAQLRARLAAPMRVELVFASQVTQEQIDGFLALGGEIDHVFQAVSYGWTGRLPRAAVGSLPGAMGDALVIVVEERPLQLHLDEATRTGRVRPVWASGFAGSASGFAGDSDITVAVLDTGVDDSHTDLAGRMEFWKDYTSDLEPTPRDIVQHGTHVAGIALGTGAAFGVGPGTLMYTDSGNLTGAPPGAGSFSFIHLPAVALTYAQNAAWLGGGTADVLAAFHANGSAAASALSAPTTGSSPTVESNTFTPSTSNAYTSFLPQNAASSISRYAIANTVTNYPAVGDGFNALRGVAPSSRWAGAKVFTNAGTGSSADTGAALDDMVVQRNAHNIKVINMSFGTIGSPGIDTIERAKANTVVNNGIVAVASAGNDGPGTGSANLVDDPGRAALVITVAASNDVNELTQYTSSGFLSPGADEDNKPDVMAPGGSDFHSSILAPDSNDADARMVGFADRVANDYYNIAGTSMAAPFVAGSAALLIDALQQAGLTWSFTSSSHPRLVKMLLCASATESNAGREAGTGSNPTLGRAATPKDRFEGYGLINPDAAIEAVSLTYTGGALSDGTAGGRFDRRAWGRKIALTPATTVALTLSVPVTADYDLYLYSGSPDSKGNPVILAASTNAGLDTDESINFSASTTETAYMFVKRVTGSGTWMLAAGPAGASPTPTRTATPSATPTRTPTPGLTATFIPTTSMTATLTRTPTSSPTRTATLTATATPTPIVSVTPTRTSTANATTTPTLPAALSPGISGRILYYSNAAPVGATTLLVNGVPMSQTDAVGNYVLNVTTGATWQQMPTKLGEMNSSVSTLDAAWVLQAALGSRSFTAEQRLAGDVTGNGSVSSLDAALILQVTLGIIPALPVTAPQRCASEWVFMPVPAAALNQLVILPAMTTLTCQMGAITYNPLSGPASNQDFEGIVFGDVTGNWRPAGGGGGTVAALRRSQTAHLQRVRGEYRLPVVVTGAGAWQALDVEVYYDARTLQAVGVRRPRAAAHALLAVNDQQPGVLRMALASPQPISRSSAAVAFVRFKARASLLPSAAEVVHIAARSE